MDNLLNNYNFPMTNVLKDLPKDAPTPNILHSFSNSTLKLIDVHASTIGFKVSKHVMKKRITTFKSY